MKRLPILSTALAFTLAAPSVLADATIHARLSGYNETPAAISTAASGDFKAKITTDGAIEYELTYADLQGDVTQSHIHFGKPGVSGGIAAWLCGTDALPGPAGTPSCGGPKSGNVTGVITAAQVIGPTGQGIAPGEFEEFVAAIREGATYVNVHSSFVGSGEIRGPIK